MFIKYIKNEVQWVVNIEYKFLKKLKNIKQIKIMGRPTSCPSSAHNSGRAPGQGDGRPPFTTDDLSSSWDVRHPLVAHNTRTSARVRVLVHHCGCSLNVEWVCNWLDQILQLIKTKTNISVDIAYFSREKWIWFM